MGDQPQVGGGVAASAAYELAVCISVPAATHYFQILAPRLTAALGGRNKRRHSRNAQATPALVWQGGASASHRAAKGQIMIRGHEVPVQATISSHRDRTAHSRLAALASIVAMASAMALLSSMAAEADAPRGSVPAAAPVGLINF